MNVSLINNPSYYTVQCACSSSLSAKNASTQTDPERPILKAVTRALRTLDLIPIPTIKTDPKAEKADFSLQVCPDHIDKEVQTGPVLILKGCSSATSIPEQEESRCCPCREGWIDSVLRKLHWNSPSPVARSTPLSRSPIPLPSTSFDPQQTLGVSEEELSAEQLVSLYIRRPQTLVVTKAPLNKSWPGDEDSEEDGSPHRS